MLPTFLDKLKNLFRLPDEQRREQLLFSRLRPGDMFIDCGANVGQETLPALQRGATVYAFEPNPFAFKVLVRNVGRSSTATLINKGVWDRAAKLKLYLHRRHDQDAVTWSTGSSLVRGKANIDPAKFVEIEVVDLAGFIESLKCRVRAVKIDVEGVEFDIINRLLDRRLDRVVDYIFVESHADKMSSLRAKEAAVKRRLTKLKVENIFLDWG